MATISIMTTIMATMSYMYYGYYSVNGSLLHPDCIGVINICDKYVPTKNKSRPVNIFANNKIKAIVTNQIIVSN